MRRRETERKGVWESVCDGVCERVYVTEIERETEREWQRSEYKYRGKAKTSNLIKLKNFIVRFECAKSFTFTFVYICLTSVWLFKWVVYFMTFFHRLMISRVCVCSPLVLVYTILFVFKLARGEEITAFCVCMRGVCVSSFHSESRDIYIFSRSDS